MQKKKSNLFVGKCRLSGSRQSLPLFFLPLIPEDAVIQISKIHIAGNKVQSFEDQKSMYQTRETFFYIWYEGAYLRRRGVIIQPMEKL